MYQEEDETEGDDGRNAAGYESRAKVKIRARVGSRAVSFVVGRGRYSVVHAYELAARAPEAEGLAVFFWQRFLKWACIIYSLVEASWSTFFFGNKRAYCYMNRLLLLFALTYIALKVCAGYSNYFCRSFW